MPTKLAKRNIKTDLEALKPYLGSRSASRGYGSAVTWENGYPTYDLRYVRLNKILLYSSGTVTQYDNDDTGMALAISAANSGDTICVPPGTLASNYTVPADVTVVGASVEDVIFSGQITLSNGSAIENLSIVRSLDDATTAYGAYASVDSDETAYICNCTIIVTQAGAGSGYATSCKYGTLEISYSRISGDDGDASVTTEWWEEGPGAIAVYKPKGASSLANSYIDLSGNGNDAYPGSVPDWNATDGWIFADSEYLICPVSITDGQVTVIMYAHTPEEAKVIGFGYTSGATPGLRVHGYYTVVGGVNPYYVSRGWYNTNQGVNKSWTTTDADTPFTVSLRGQYYYENKTLRHTAGALGTGTTGELWIGEMNGYEPRDTTGYIYALAIYDRILTQEQLFALHDAIIAL